MDDQGFGSAVRAVRQRRGWRQSDLAERAGVSQSTVSRLERGHPGPIALDAIRRITGELDIRVELLARWRSGDLDRMLNRRHAQLHEAVATWFRRSLPDWQIAPEVSFSIYGERGVIDALAWHHQTRTLLVIELKTDVVDVNELLGTFDRKLRLARFVAKDRGWTADTMSGWVIVAPGRLNRERIAAHGSALRAALPGDGRSIAAWLRRPRGRALALSIWRNSRPGTHMADLTSIRRVRPSRPKAA